MHDMSDQDRLAVLGEALMDELRAIREYVSVLPTMEIRLNKVEEYLEVIRSDAKVTKAALKDYGLLHKSHDNKFKEVTSRISKLEQYI